MARQLLPQQVFTPRSSSVNSAMYVSRTSQEAALERAFKGSKNIIIFGESGCGKSWLYKQKLSDLGRPFLVANMANVSRCGSVNGVFEDCFNRIQKKAIKGDTFKAGGSLNLGVAKFEIAYVEQAQNLSIEPFEKCLSLIGNVSKRTDSFIVIENIESIIDNPNHVKDIAGLLTLVDDEDYAQYGVKLLIVGVPDDIQRYLTKTSYGNTIANRLIEIPEVSRLSKAEAIKLLIRGFSGLLKYKISEDVSPANIAWFADNIPQHLHELGFEIACLSEKRRVVTRDNVTEGLINWVRSTLTNDYVALEANMNSRNTKAGRRNQTIFSIANWEKPDFKPSDIETILRKNFPKSTFNTKLNVAQMLSDLAKQPHPIIRKTPNGDAYRFISPKTKVCARAMLKKASDETVQKMAQIEL